MPFLRGHGAPESGVAGSQMEIFVVAKNPDEASSLPYLVRLPIDGGLILKARDTWPTTARLLPSA